MEGHLGYDDAWPWPFTQDYATPEPSLLPSSCDFMNPAPFIAGLYPTELQRDTRLDEDFGTNDDVLAPSFDLELSDVHLITDDAEVLKSLEKSLLQSLEDTLGQQNHAYRPPHRQSDLLVEQSPIRIANQMLTPAELSQLRKDAPRLEDHVQWPHVDFETPNLWKEREADAPFDVFYPIRAESEFRYTGQTDELAPYPPRCSGRIAVIIGQHLSEDLPVHLFEHPGCQGVRDSAQCPSTCSYLQSTISSPPTILPQPKKDLVAKKPTIKNVPYRYACAECVLANKTSNCDGSPDALCSRCKRIVRKERDAQRRLYPHLDHPILSVPEIIIFDLKEIHALMLRLRRMSISCPSHRARTPRRSISTLAAKFFAMSTRESRIHRTPQPAPLLQSPD
ncbi:hypothetical protein B0T25DRAFT_236781 [Lasiosphaeria hispida]|uniref:Uncharacterized protein n=1 Tax=Lasiosphaeria hispida TaxID=260671 RepID=A0AAJ0HE58_9PEZI|nr:hypothetical protein B0T25DRAFT_236781 [Lasiosphaeria hispida]